MITKLMQYDQEKRITASEALGSPWIQKFNVAKEGKEGDLSHALKSLRQFHTEMTFQKGVLAYIASQRLSIKEEAALRTEFDKFDVNKDGFISKDELIKAYIPFCGSYESAKAEGEKVFLKIDFNSNGVIDYNGISLIYII